MTDFPDASSKQLLLYDPSKGINQSEILIKPYKDILTKVSITNDKIIGLYYLDGYYTVSIFDLEGKLLKSIPFPVGSKVSGLNAEQNDETTFCYMNSFYFPNVVYEFNIKELKFKLLDRTYINFEYQKHETTYVRYVSKDSIEIPMYITFKKGLKRNNSNTTLLYGYGGFGIIMAPFYRASTIVWLENGGILAVPLIRGGGEQGTDWSRNGKGLKRLNSFNDFIGAARYLIDSGYTNPNKLAIEGGSNGGLLVGVAMTKNPELFKAAIPEMGVMDMLRYQNFTIGSFVESEYGSSSNEVNFKNLYSYSPIHNIKQGVKYPATLAITSDNDDRVPPLHSYKFIATLQEKGDNSMPYLLYVNKLAGHDGSEIVKQWLDIEGLKLAFLFDILNVKVKSVW